MIKCASEGGATQYKVPNRNFAGIFVPITPFINYSSVLEHSIATELSEMKLTMRQHEADLTTLQIELRKNKYWKFEAERKRDNLLKVGFQNYISNRYKYSD